MKWKNLKTKQHFVFNDGSKLIQTHEIQKLPTYKISYGRKKEIIVSEDHYLLCDISHVAKTILNQLFLEEKQNSLQYIPREFNVEFQFEKGLITAKEAFKKYDSVFYSDNLHWLNAGTIHTLLLLNQPLNFINKDFKKVLINSCKYQGKRECFCVSTNTGVYECCGIIHHNSVTLRNLIFHSLTHGEDIKLAMVDLKLSEFTFYKGMNNVVGVANNPQEAVEILRLAREVMYKRNKLNAERGLTDYLDWKPQKPTGKYSLYGVEYDEGTIFDVKVGNETKQMTIEDMFDYVQGTK